MAATITIDYDDEKHDYRIDGERVPSVTQILDQTEPKPALTWWGYRVGLRAVVELLQTGRLVWPALMEIVPAEAIHNRRLPEHEQVKPLLERIAVTAGLHPNKIKDDAADLGSLVHNVAQDLGAGVMPTLDDYPNQARGFVRALLNWWLDQEPEFDRQEVIVGSRTHTYAGRFDAVMHHPHLKLGLIDFKTSIGVYRSHGLQLELYEAAWEEMGGDPFDFKAIVHLKHDGTYQQIVVPAHGAREAALARVAAYHADRVHEEAWKAVEPKKPRRSKAIAA